MAKIDSFLNPNFSFVIDLLEVFDVIRTSRVLSTYWFLSGSDRAYRPKNGVLSKNMRTNPNFNIFLAMCMKIGPYEKLLLMNIFIIIKSSSGVLLRSYRSIFLKDSSLSTSV